MLVRYMYDWTTTLTTQLFSLKCLQISLFQEKYLIQPVECFCQLATVAIYCNTTDALILLYLDISKHNSTFYVTGFARQQRQFEKFPNKHVRGITFYSKILKVQRQAQHR